MPTSPSTDLSKGALGKSGNGKATIKEMNGRSQRTRRTEKTKGSELNSSLCDLCDPLFKPLLFSLAAVAMQTVDGRQKTEEGGKRAIATFCNPAVS
jgi:hypothetical protein